MISLKRGSKNALSHHNSGNSMRLCFLKMDSFGEQFKKKKRRRGEGGEGKGKRGKMPAQPYCFIAILRCVWLDWLFYLKMFSVRQWSGFREAQPPAGLEFKVNEKYPLPFQLIVTPKY